MTTNNAVNTTLAGQTGTGTFVGSTSPTLVTPLLGTPTSGVLTNTTGGGGLRSFQFFTTGTAATYTKPANITSILVEMVGGGGGGGGSSTCTASQLSCGGGGGAGGYARTWIVSAAATYTYTVGAAGTGGTAGGGTGGTGGTTTFSFGSMSASGGTGGVGGSAIATSSAGQSIGGSGGVGANANTILLGSAGQWAMTSQGGIIGAIGGVSFFGGGGVAGTPGAGGNGAVGSGGGGATTFQSGTGQAGGNGGTGYIIVWEFS